MLEVILQVCSVSRCDSPAVAPYRILDYLYAKQRKTPSPLFQRMKQALFFEAK